MVSFEKTRMEQACLIHDDPVLSCRSQTGIPLVTLYIFPQKKKLDTRKPMVSHTLKQTFVSTLRECKLLSWFQFRQRGTLWDFLKPDSE